MKNNLKNIALVLIVAIMLAGTASAAASVTVTDGTSNLDIWTYGNHNSATSGFESYFSSSIVGSTWTNADGRLAVISEDGYMNVETEYPVNNFCIIFASDSNDGFARVFIDEEMVWQGDTWADVSLGQDINQQKIRSLMINGLEYNTHSIVIKNVNVAQEEQMEVRTLNVEEANAHDGHVTIYEYGYNLPDTEEIPEFPTIAAPIAAIIGLAFIFSKRKEE
ncbi:PEF-CTERM protein sorting domain-containing protein [Methanolobus vulcani]|uniref:PEF-CTERM protein sorting domain-containing protein n=1 Tax=Methanolobus vulcani TaxID=38026 RepID=A0A7Z7AWV3_9EURY|nr:PEF-CTERM sorting domain-containing protein [Methanolobus vulcani]SDF88565.1 PEF-CTERM protein sorting domain-containing protein [Methanolobus vulcani]